MRWMVMPIMRWSDFRGRSQRREYWMFVVLQWLLLGVLGFAFSLAGGDFVALRDNPFSGAGAAPVVITGWGIVLLLFVPWMGVTVRRLHDRDNSGWLLLSLLVPYIGTVALIYCTVRDGNMGTNRYGPDPKGRDDDRIDSPHGLSGMPRRPPIA